MTFSEWVLLRFSRELEEPEYYIEATKKWNADTALHYISQAYPGFVDSIKGRHVLDYGCGPGWQSVAMALAGAASVTGVDVRQKWLEFACKLSQEYHMTDRVRMIDAMNKIRGEQFDVVLSQDSFEHYSNPSQSLNEMQAVLKPGGRIYIIFSGPWYSPWGSHMTVFTPLPWVNLLFSEKTIMKVRSRYRHDGASRYEEIDSGLNKMTVAKFNRIIKASGMLVENMFYHGFKGMNFMVHIPVMRELFADQLGCILVKKT